MIVTHEVMINCTGITGEECNDNCITSLGHGTDFNLKAELPTDTLHGSVSIIHNDLPLPHVVIVEVYEEDEAPTNLTSHGITTGRQSTLARPAVMPTEQDLINKLETLA
tara:strand:+ start:425 stop:751 length:327 start_codon:yes stop_codon:yes gene_type:complete